MGIGEHQGILTQDLLESAFISLVSIRETLKRESGYNGPIDVLLCENANNYWYKVCHLLNMNVVTVKTDEFYQMDIDDLKGKVNSRTKVLVVSLGNSKFGTSDNLE